MLSLDLAEPWPCPSRTRNRSGKHIYPRRAEVRHVSDAAGLEIIRARLLRDGKQRGGPPSGDEALHNNGGTPGCTSNTNYEMGAWAAAQSTRCGRQRRPHALKNTDLGFLQTCPWYEVTWSEARLPTLAANRSYTEGATFQGRGPEGHRQTPALALARAPPDTTSFSRPFR